MADKIGFKYFETSAYTNEGVKEMMDSLVIDLVKSKKSSKEIT